MAGRSYGCLAGPFAICLPPPACKTPTHHVVRALESPGLQFFKQPHRVATSGVPPLPQVRHDRIGVLRCPAAGTLGKGLGACEAADRATVQPQPASDLAMAHAVLMEVSDLLIEFQAALTPFELSLPIARRLGFLSGLLACTRVTG